MHGADKTAAQPALSLYAIEDSLQQLQEARDSAELEGDSEALKVIDQQFIEYLTKEVCKVDSWAGLIRRLEDEAEACAREATRLSDRAVAMKNRVTDLKATALFVMQRFDVKELKTPTNTLRRQVNGGLQALEVTERAALPMSMFNVAVRMDGETFVGFMEKMEVESSSMLRISSIMRAYALFEADTNRIRETLKQRVPCKRCGGTGNTRPPMNVCEVCEGSGTIPNTVPGARLVPRGEHIRVL